MLATTLSAEFDTSTVPLAATMPWGLSKEAPGGAVNVTALIVSGVGGGGRRETASGSRHDGPATPQRPQMQVGFAGWAWAGDLSVRQRVKRVTTHEYPA